MYTLNKIVGYLISPVGFSMALAAAAVVVRMLGRRKLAGWAVVLALANAWLWSTPLMSQLMGVALEGEFLSGGRVPPVESLPNADLIELHGGGMGLATNIGYHNDGGGSPLKVLRLVDDAVMKANAFLVNGNIVAEDYIDRVLALVGPNGDAAWLELLSSVHWLCHEDQVTTSNDAFAKLWEWNDRKRRFTHRQVDFAFERLKQQGWVV